MQTEAVASDWRTTDAPFPSEGLKSASQKIAEITNQAFKIGQTISDHADRILGSRPEAEKEGYASPVRIGALGEIHAQIDQLGSAIIVLHEQTERLNAI